MGGIQNNEKIAELCGAIIGDGWIQSNERAFFIAGDPQEDKEYYDVHLKQMFEEVLTPVNPKEFPYWKVYGIGIYKKEIIKNLLGWGLPKGSKAKTAKAPEWILKGDEKIIKSFLRGVFDTDGCVFCQKAYGKYNSKFDKTYHSKIRLRIGMISPYIIEDLFYLCQRIGLRVTKIKIKGGFRNNRNNNEAYILNINEISSINKWFNEVSPSNKRHTTKYLIWKKFGFCPPKTNLKQREEILKNKLNPYILYKQG